GTWSGTAPIALAERWQRCNGAGLACADIAGASGSSYTVAPPDLGHVLRYVVTASNAGGTVATSATVFVPEPATPSGGGGGGGGGGGVPPDLRVTWPGPTRPAPPSGRAPGGGRAPAPGPGTLAPPDRVDRDRAARRYGALGERNRVDRERRRVVLDACVDRPSRRLHGYADVVRSWA